MTLSFCAENGILSAEIFVGRDGAVPEIRIFVCCHKQAPVPAFPFLQPMQVGAALTQERWPGFQPDDEGENISAKNRSYCELTAQFWAWKHCRADWVGLFHYRRYLAPQPGARLPYRIEKRPTEALLRALGYDGFPALIGENDLILPQPEEMYVPVREHYATAPGHRAADLALMEQILRERQPEYLAAAERYLSGTRQVFGNIFVMRSALFKAYCAWLFPLLEEFDRRADWANRTAQELRADGYLAERLLGVYVTQWEARLRVVKLPRVHFDAIYTAPDRKMRALYRLLPPGSRRRAVVKKLLRSKDR